MKITSKGPAYVLDRIQEQWLLLFLVGSMGMVPLVHAQGQATRLDVAEAKGDQASDWVLNYEPNPCGNYAKAAFRFWSPPYKESIQGIIVLVPGSNEDGRGMLESAAWRAMASKYKLAIVSCDLEGENYFSAQDGTGEALLEAINDFAERSGHVELAGAKLLLYGESAGGQFNYNFTLWKPDRVMAFVVNKGGFYNLGIPAPESCSVPGLFIFGQVDAYFRKEAIIQIWSEGRKRGARWALAPEPGAGHDFSKTPAMAQSFFEGTLRERLTAAPDALNGEHSKARKQNQGWIGNLTTYEINDASTRHQSPLGCAWLPNEESAKAWRAFVTSEE